MPLPKTFKLLIVGKAVIVKSFARIHETNLKKQGILAVTFEDKIAYNKILEDDIINVISLEEFSPGKRIKVEFVDTVTISMYGSLSFNSSSSYILLEITEL